MQVSSQQLCWWLLPEEEDVSIALELEKDNYGRLFALLKHGIPSVKDKDIMWHTAMGVLRTGSFIQRYNIPGAKLGCKFCSNPLETRHHLILECPGLKVYSDKIIDSAGELGLTLPTKG